jgi:hypothetical protein
MGRALTNVNVTFSINNQRLGTVRTDSRGTAQIQYIPQETGTFSLTAEFNGTGTYYGCAQTVHLVVGNPLQSTAPGNIPTMIPAQALFGVAAGGGTIVLGAVVVVRRKRRSIAVQWEYDMGEIVRTFVMRDVVRTLELSADSLDRTAKAFERAVGNGSG